MVLDCNCLISTKTYCTVHHDGSLSCLRVCDNKADAKSDKTFGADNVDMSERFPLFALPNSMQGK